MERTRDGRFVNIDVIFDEDQNVEEVHIEDAITGQQIAFWDKDLCRDLLLNL